jgi:alpha-galactosidase
MMIFVKEEEVASQQGGLKIVCGGNVTVDLKEATTFYYYHGFQSWSLSSWVDVKTTDMNLPPKQEPSILRPMQIDVEYDEANVPHSNWVGAVKRGNDVERGLVVLLGCLDLDSHVFLHKNKDGGETLVGTSKDSNAKWLVAVGKELDVFDEYANQLKRHRGFSKTNKAAPSVWCSWYSLYTHIDEEVLEKIYDDLDDIGFDVLQIDDGWQVKVGDWSVNDKFKKGMKHQAEVIMKKHNRTAGLWLAPLIAQQSSQLFQTHPQWFLRDAAGAYVSAGFNWFEQLYALDVTHPEVEAFLTDLMAMVVNEWGYKYIKLDFLYAGALEGVRHNNSMTREQSMEYSLGYV